MGRLLPLGSSLIIDGIHLTTRSRYGRAAFYGPMSGGCYVRPVATSIFVAAKPEFQQDSLFAARLRSRELCPFLRGLRPAPAESLEEMNHRLHTGKLGLSQLVLGREQSLLCL